MSAPTIYRWDDPGAPALTGYQDGFYEVLRACLVDGYPGKLPAGWSEVYDEWQTSGVATFENSGQSGVLGIYKASTVNRPPFLFVAEAMIDAVTPINGRSGDAPVSDLTADLTESASTTQRTVSGYNQFPYWVVVANENFAWLVLGASATIFSTSIQQQRSYSVVGVGAFNSVRGLGPHRQPASGNFVIIGGAKTSQQSSSFAYTHITGNTMSANCGTAFFAADNAPVSGNAGLLLWPFCSTTTTVNYMLPADTDAVVSLPLVAAAIYINEYSATSEVIRDCEQIGMLPGLLAVPGECSYSNSASEAPYLDSADFTDVISIADRNCLKFRGGDIFAFLSLDEADW